MLGAFIFYAVYKIDILKPMCFTTGRAFPLIYIKLGYIYYSSILIPPIFNTIIFISLTGHFSSFISYYNFSILLKKIC